MNSGLETRVGMLAIVLFNHIYGKEGYRLAPSLIPPRVQILSGIENDHIGSFSILAERMRCRLKPLPLACTGKSKLFHYFATLHRTRVQISLFCEKKKLYDAKGHKAFSPGGEDEIRTHGTAKTAHTLSKRAPSTTRTSLRCVEGTDVRADSQGLSHTPATVSRKATAGGSAVCVER